MAKDINRTERQISKSEEARRLKSATSAFKHELDFPDSRKVL